jgi:aspartyl protease family protein
MIKPLLLVVAFGVGIGLLVPTGRQTTLEVPPASPPASPARAGPVAQPASSPASPGPAGDTLIRRNELGFFIDGTVNQQPVRFVVDTGASAVALTVEDARRIGLNFSESEFTVVGRGASGDVMGKPVMLDTVTIEGKQVSQVRAVICRGLHVSLLGQTYLSRIGSVQMNGDYMVLR